jgi:hypothetical protein
MCHPILSRALYNKRGYVFHPEYFGVFCDNDFTVRTQLECPILQVKGLEWNHDHPSNGTRVEDDVVRHQNSEAAYRYGATKMVEMWPMLTLFNRCRSVESDIHAHLLRLAQLARECNHVTEFGVRSGMSTFAFLHGLIQQVAPGASQLRSRRSLQHLFASPAIAGGLAFPPRHHAGCRCHRGDGHALCRYAPHLRPSEGRARAPRQSGAQIYCIPRHGQLRPCRRRLPASPGSISRSKNSCATTRIGCFSSTTKTITA